MLVRIANRKDPDQTASSGIYKMLIRIANRENPVRLLLKKQSNLDLPCLSPVEDNKS